MRTHLSTAVWTFGGLALAAIIGGPAWAQSDAEKPPQYTYISTWAIPRAMWADYQKTLADENEMMSKAVADGTLTAFGDYSVLNHQEGEQTHGSWFSAGSMANLMKALEALRGMPGNASPPLAAAKHWDYIDVSRDYHAHSGTFTNGYLRVGHWNYRAGADDPDGKILRATMVAQLEKLFSEGALHAYQVDTEAVHSADPNGFDVAIIANGAEGLDKFEASVESMGKSNPAGLAGFGSLIDPHGHRDLLGHVDTMTYK